MPSTLQSNATVIVGADNTNMVAASATGDIEDALDMLDDVQSIVLSLSPRSQEKLLEALEELNQEVGEPQNGAPQEDTTQPDTNGHGGNAEHVPTTQHDVQEEQAPSYQTSTSRATPATHSEGTVTSNPSTVESTSTTSEGSTQSSTTPDGPSAGTTAATTPGSTSDARQEAVSEGSGTGDASSSSIHTIPPLFDAVEYLRQLQEAFEAWPDRIELPDFPESLAWTVPIIADPPLDIYSTAGEAPVAGPSVGPPSLGPSEAQPSAHENRPSSVQPTYNATATAGPSNAPANELQPSAIDPRLLQRRPQPPAAHAHLHTPVTRAISPPRGLPHGVHSPTVPPPQSTAMPPPSGSPAAQVQRRNTQMQVPQGQQFQTPTLPRPCPPVTPECAGSGPAFLYPANAYLVGQAQLAAQAQSPAPQFAEGSSKRQARPTVPQVQVAGSSRTGTPSGISQVAVMDAHMRQQAYMQQHMTYNGDTTAFAHAGHGTASGSATPAAYNSTPSSLSTPAMQVSRTQAVAPPSTSAAASSSNRSGQMRPPSTMPTRAQTPASGTRAQARGTPAPQVRQQGPARHAGGSAHGVQAAQVSRQAAATPLPTPRTEYHQNLAEYYGSRTQELQGQQSAPEPSRSPSPVPADWTVVVERYMRLTGGGSGAQGGLMAGPGGVQGMVAQPAQVDSRESWNGGHPPASTSQYSVPSLLDDLPPLSQPSNHAGASSSQPQARPMVPLRRQRAPATQRQQQATPAPMTLAPAGSMPPRSRMPEGHVSPAVARGMGPPPPIAQSHRASRQAATSTPAQSSANLPNATQVPEHLQRYIIRQAAQAHQHAASQATQGACSAEDGSLTPIDNVVYGVTTLSDDAGQAASRPGSARTPASGSGTPAPQHYEPAPHAGPNRLVPSTPQSGYVHHQNHPAASSSRDAPQQPAQGSQAGPSRPMPSSTPQPGYAPPHAASAAPCSTPALHRFVQAVLADPTRMPDMGDYQPGHTPAPPASRPSQAPMASLTQHPSYGGHQQPQAGPSRRVPAAGAAYSGSREDPLFRCPAGGSKCPGYWRKGHKGEHFVTCHAEIVPPEEQTAAELATGREIVRCTIPHDGPRQEWRIASESLPNHISRTHNIRDELCGFAPPQGYGAQQAQHGAYASPPQPPPEPPRRRGRKRREPEPSDVDQLNEAEDTGGRRKRSKRS